MKVQIEFDTERGFSGALVKFDGKKQRLINQLDLHMNMNEPIDFRLKKLSAKDGFFKPMYVEELVGSEMVVHVGSR